MTKHDDDLFKDTTMTFGQHLEELRGSLFKALIGLVLGCIIGLFLGKAMVGVILGPLEESLETYYSVGSLAKYETWAQQRREANLPVPYSTEEIEQLVYKDRMLFEIMYVDPRQALDETLRAHPEWGDQLRLPPEPPPPAASTQQSIATATTGGATEASEALQPSPILKRLVPVLLFHLAVEDDRVHAKSFSFPETFGIWLKASLVIGAILSSPWVFYQIWSFVAAGLYPHEKRYIHVFLPFSLGLFLLGAATAYLLVFRPVLGFLLTFNSSLGIDPDPRISEWLGFVMLLPLGFGVAFQLPLVMLFLERIGIFNLRTYIEKWRIAVLVIFIISAVLTPADPYSILFMAVPLTLLYFGGLLLCRFLPNKRAGAVEVPSD